MWNATGYGLIQAAVIAIAALGFNLLLSVSDILNIGFVLLMTLGQFLALALHDWGAGLPLSFIGAIVLTSLANLVIFTGFVRPLRTRGRPISVIIIVTFLLYSGGQGIIVMLFGESSYNLGLPAGLSHALHMSSFYFTVGQATILITAALVVAVADAVLRFTKWGRLVRAVSDDIDLAKTSGLAVNTVELATWATGGALAAISGLSLIVIDVNFSARSVAPFFVFVIAAAFCGGAGKPLGAPIGALIVGLITEWSALVVAPVLAPLIAFVVLILIVVIRPSGVLGFAREAMRA